MTKHEKLIKEAQDFLKLVDGFYEKELEKISKETGQSKQQLRKRLRGK